MSKSMVELLQKLDIAKTREEVNSIIEDIAEIGEPAIDELLHYAKQRYRKPGNLTIARILQKMGYPANRKGIPFLIAQVSDINSSGYEVALDALVEIGEPTIPAIKEALQFYSQDLHGYELAIQGLTTLLGLLGSPTIDPLLSELLHMLESGNDKNNVDFYVLLPLRKIGSPQADAAIAYIGKMIDSQRSTEIKREAIEALLDFDPKSVIPLMPIIKKNLDNDDESIRNSAEIVLKKLDRGKSEICR